MAVAVAVEQANKSKRTKDHDKASRHVSSASSCIYVACVYAGIMKRYSIHIHCDRSVQRGLAVTRYYILLLIVTKHSTFGSARLQVLVL